MLPCGAASGGIFSPKMVSFSLKVRNSLAALPPAAISHQKRVLFFKSPPIGGGAASGGNFPQQNDPFSLETRQLVAALPLVAILHQQMPPFSLKVLYVVAALPPAAIFHQKATPFSLKVWNFTDWLWLRAGSGCPRQNHCDVVDDPVWLWLWL